MEPQLRDVAELGTDDDDGRRPGVQRRDERSDVPGFRRVTGKVLWEFPTNSGIYAPATSFAIDGKQYVAVLSGWGQDAKLMQTRIDAVSPGSFPEVPEGGVIWVFALK